LAWCLAGCTPVKNALAVWLVELNKTGSKLALFSETTDFSDPNIQPNPTSQQPTTQLMPTQSNPIKPTQTQPSPTEVNTSKVALFF
jgi:hypothetical protein